MSRRYPSEANKVPAPITSKSNTPANIRFIFIPRSLPFGRPQGNPGSKGIWMIEPD
jgi:hypothetical protein